MSHQNNGVFPLHAVSRCIRDLDKATRELSEVITRQLNAVISADAEKVMALTEKNVEVQQDFHEKEQAFIAELKQLITGSGNGSGKGTGPENGFENSSGPENSFENSSGSEEDSENGSENGSVPENSSENSSENSNSNKPPVTLEGLKQIYPGYEIYIREWQEQITGNIDRLERQEKQLVQLLDFAQKQNSALMRSVYTLQSGKNLHYRQNGEKSGVSSGIAVNQEG